MIKKPVKATKDSLMIEDANGAYIISVCTTREVRDEIVQALNGYGEAKVAAVPKTLFDVAVKERDELKADLEVLSETLCQYGEALGELAEAITVGPHWWEANFQRLLKAKSAAEKLLDLNTVEASCWD